MSVLKKILLIIPLIIFISSCKDEVTKPGENSEQFRAHKEKINKIADSLTTSRIWEGFEGMDMNLPGVVIGVWSENSGFSYVTAKGKADLETGRALKSDDLFRIASNTKTFTITVLLQLVEEGRISLDDKLSKYIPDWPRADEVTIRMMCNMTSGIFELTDNPDFETKVTANPLRRWTPFELVNLAKNQPYYFTPGTDFHYSNTNTTLLGIIIEKLTGNTLHQEIKTRIINKLNLTSTFIPDDQYFPEGRSFSKGYDFEDMSNYKVEVTERYSPTIYWSSGDIISNFDDIKLWVKALAEGKLLTSAMQSERLKTFSPAFNGIPFLEDSKYGLGIIDYYGYIGHGGDNFGYHSYMCYNPVKKIGIVVLCNYVASALSTADEVLAIIDPELN